MENPRYNKLLRPAREYILMTVGLLIYSFGWIACIKPMEVAAGGGTGLSMIISHTASEMWGSDLGVGAVFLILNVMLLIVSGFTVGWNFGFKTLYCIVVASGFMAWMEPYLLTHYPPAGDVIGLDDKLLTIILGALLAGANLLGNFMTLSRIPMVLANAIAALDIAPMLVMIAIILVLCFLGCFIPAIPLVLICVPIFVPIAKVFGWNLVWFGVISTLIKNMACITPPFGINLFVMKGIADVPIGLMYKASLPYVVGLFVCVGLIVAFPQLSLWLPSMMH